MPTYEYACQDCNEHLEVVQSFKDEALTTCGACGGSLRKVFSAAGIIFKGSGYYVNDSRSKKATTAPASGAKSDDASGSSSGDSSGDSSGSSTAAPKKTPDAAAAATTPKSESA